MQHRILSRTLQTQATASDVYAALCKDELTEQPKSHTALFETAAVGQLHHIKSLLMLSAAVRIECRNKQVHFIALSDNGRHFLQDLKPLFDLPVEIKDNERGFVIDCSSHTQTEEDEEARLRAFNIFEPLRQTQELLRSGDAEQDAVTFLFGYFAYDIVDQFEDIPDSSIGDKDIPDYVYYLADQLFIRDEQSEQAKLLIREHIKAGDVFQTVLSRQFELPCDDAFAAYQVLKQHNPSPYMFFLQGERHAFFGASPESAVKFTASNREVTIYPIAGTHRRGTDAQGRIDPDLDSRIEASLKQNTKELAEHMMLVDLARNDIARVCKSGTRRVRELLQVVRYAHVMHLVSEVIGELDEGFDALHAYQACHNMGTLVGAPKIKATTILRKLEHNYRGTYGGAVGYLNAAGDMDTAIIIRTAQVRNGIATVQAGAGVVLDSDPDSEVQETCNKASAVIRACLAVSDPNRKIETEAEKLKRSKESWVKW